MDGIKSDVGQSRRRLIRRQSRKIMNLQVNHLYMDLDDAIKESVLLLTTVASERAARSILVVIIASLTSTTESYQNRTII